MLSTERRGRDLLRPLRPCVSSISSSSVVRGAAPGRPRSGIFSTPKRSPAPSGAKGGLGASGSPLKFFKKLVGRNAVKLAALSLLFLSSAFSAAAYALPASRRHKRPVEGEVHRSLAKRVAPLWVGQGRATRPWFTRLLARGLISAVIRACEPIGQN